ncbi:MAG: SusC/RagA family TonB-linked outer membrane protein, partial [Bacteroidota bacterium]
IDWLTKDQYLAASLSGAANFGDVRDFPFFDTNEQKVLWGNATSQEHQLSVSARGEKSGYRVSLGYLNDGSLLQAGNNSNKRYNLRLSHDYQFSKKLSLESNLSIENQVIVQPTRLGDIMNNGNQPGKPASGLGLTGLPYVWGSGIGNASVNALADYGGDNTQSDVRIIGNFKFTYDILPNLKAVAAVGYSSLNTDYRTVENSIGFYDYVGTTKLADLPSRTSYQRGNKNEGNFTTNAYLEYNKKIGLDNSFRVTGGVQYERYEYNRFIAKTFDVVSGVPSSLSLSTGDATSKSVAEAQFHTALAGYFGRFNYSFKDKYLLEGNVRYDGSSKFSAANRWKPFYGVSAGWILSEEDFLKDNNIINSLKLRASYGLMGNQSGIGSYDYIQFLNLNYSTSNTASGFPILGTSPVVRITPSGTLVADDRTWETIRTQNIGLDFGLLKNRLSGSFDYFVKNNDNMLINRTYPTVLGATAPQGNNGKLQVWGWDLALTWRDKIGNFSYHIGGVLSDNQNKLLSFGGQNVIGTGTRGLNSAVEGYPINSYFGLEYAGRIQTQADLENYSKYITGNNIGIPSGGATSQANGKLALGDNMYKDLNGDGKITYPQDAKFLGTDAPRYSFSFNGGFEYKGFDFNAIFQGVGKRTLIRDGNWRIPGAVIFQAQNAAFVDQYWLPTHTDARLPRPSTTGTINNYNYFASDWVAEDGSYLRLKNIVLGYTIPAKFTKKLKVERLRVYFSGNDLWEITKIQDGWDPESTQSVANTADSENNGVSTFSQRFPLYRYLTFGLNVTF